MKTVPLKRVVGINLQTLPETTEPGFEFRYVDIGAVGRGQLNSEPEATVFASAPSRARRLVRQGDTIISTVRTYLRAVWPVQDSATDLVVSTGFAVLTPTRSIDSRYLGWLVQSDVVVEEVVARSVGVSYPAINPSDIGTVRVPLPPLAHQRAIADYLDRETARIDAVIEKKQRMLELLEERLQVQVDLATVPGDEPLVSLRRYVSDACDGPFGSALKSEHYTESGARVIRLGNIGRASWSDGDVARIPFGYWAELEHHHAQAGDVVIAGLGDEGNPVGRACVLPELGPALVKADCYRLRLREGAADGVYLAWYLSSRRGLANAERMAEGSTRPRLTLAKALALPIPLLTVDRQHAIARCLVDQFARFEAVKKPLSSQIALLQEHRQALITAAVTGDLEIPGVAA